MITFLCKSLILFAIVRYFGSSFALYSLFVLYANVCFVHKFCSTGCSLFEVNVLGVFHLKAKQDM